MLLIFTSNKEISNDYFTAILFENDEAGLLLMCSEIPKFCP